MSRLQKSRKNRNVRDCSFSRIKAIVRSTIPAPLATVLRTAKSIAFGLKSWAAMKRCSLRPKSALGTVVILSLGGRHGSPILAKSVQELGYDIHVISPRFPSYEGQFARGWTRCDPVLDVVGTIKAARKIAPLSALVEHRNILLPAKSEIHNALGLRDVGELSFKASNSKISMREALRDAGVPQLKWCKHENYQSGQLGYPLIVKPEQGTGSRGVILAQNETDVENALKLNKTLSKGIIAGGRILMEEFIDGHNYDVTGIYRDGELYPFIVQAMQFTSVDGALPASWYLLNAPIEDALRNRLIAKAKAHLNDMDVKVGAFTCEIRMDNVGNFFVTDFANRCATPLSTSMAAGASLTEYYARAMLEEEFKKPDLKNYVVFQRFVRNEDELSRYRAFIKQYPEMVYDARLLKSQYADVLTLARISLFATTYEELKDALGEHNLIPPEFSQYGFN